MGFSFVSSDFRNALDRLFETAQNNLDSNDDELKKWSHIIRSLKGFCNEENLRYLDENLKQTKKWNLFDLNQLAKIILDDDLEHLKYGALSFYIYLKEWEFRRGIKENEQQSPIVRSFYDFIYTEKNQRYLEFKTHYDFVDELPFVICGEIYSNSKLNEIRKFIEEKDFSDYKELIQKSDDASELIKNWEQNFECKLQDVDNVVEKLEKYKTTYDFVLLNKGFQQLYDQKKVELKRTKDMYGFVSTVMFMVPFFELIILIGALIYFQGNLPSSMWLISIPFITLILITLYLVKISLQDKRSVQSQMMQLELRMALCQFIHNYAEDSEKLHAKNKAGFEKFENIIFSPLVSSDEKIPTTFDGMEQLAKLVSEFRKS
ncbi:hypothetical protein [Acinetobacter sp. YH16032]|uniref:hypothetical protein n=1 Tax=Acinetobacter sp. YH16032 TaxID=2601181 RepID=UPI00211E961F|nr:hypothetical protein [Acinetobacter sp. YH16032]